MTSTFRLPHVPVTSETDTTRDFEQLQVLLSEGLTAANLKAEAVTESRIAKEAVSESKLTAALVAKLNPGAWTNPESISAKLTESTIQARTEAGSTTAALKGLAKTTAEIKVGETVFTLKSTHRPPQQVNGLFGMFTATPANLLLIETSGVATARLAIPTGTFVSFDGVRFNLT